MNKSRTRRTFLLKLAAAALLAGLAAPAAPAAQKKPAARQPGQSQAREDFYIIVSVNQAGKSLVLKLPTEVTTVMTVNGQTAYLDEKGQRIQFAALHAGDTVYVVHQHLTENEDLALRIRKGPMTVQELHRRYVTFT